MSEIVRKPVLETKHLGISFGGLHAVQDFNLSIYSGELVGKSLAKAINSMKK